MKKLFQLFVPVFVLAALTLFASIPASAQNGSLYKDYACRFTPAGAFPAAGATVTICTSSGSGTPCTPTVAAVYSDPALTPPVPNPLALCKSSPQFDCIDNLGNWSVYLAPAVYTYAITGARLSPYGPISFGVSCVAGTTCGAIPGAVTNASANASQGDFLGVLSTSPTVYRPAAPGAPVNVQSGAAYRIVCRFNGGMGDRGYWVLRTNSSAENDTLDAAGSGVSLGSTGCGSALYFLYGVWGTPPAIGAVAQGATLNVTPGPNNSRISMNGAPLVSSMPLPAGEFAFLTNAGTNWDAIVPILSVPNNILPGNFARFADIDGSQSLYYASFGDSLTACAGIVTLANCYPNRIAAAKAFTLSNNGVSSTAANDDQQIGTIIRYANGVTSGTYTWLCCVNDMRNNLTAAQQADWAQTVEAGLWWLATPDINKVLASSASVTYAGTWVTPASSYGGTMRSATANGSTASFRVFGTDVVVIGAWQTLQAGSSSATWNITLDGVTGPTVTTSTGSYSSMAFNTNFGPTFIHYTNLQEKTHSVTLTCVTATVQNPCYFVAGGTSSGAMVANGKWVYYGNTVRMVNPTGYNVPTSPGCPVAPCGSDSLVQQFDDLARTFVADLQSVGLNVVYVDINAPGFYLPNGTNTQGDGVHPSDIGDGLIANAFLNAMKGFMTPSDRGAGQSKGLIPIAAKVDLLGLSASNASGTTFYTVPAGGMYRVSGYIVLTQQATTSSTLPNLQVFWTDLDTAANEFANLTVVQGANTVGTYGTNSLVNTGSPAVINAQAGTPIKWATTGYLSSGVTPMQYAVHIKLEYLGP